MVSHRCLCASLFYTACVNMQGGSKKPETFLEAVRGAWFLLTGNIGGVRVDFSQPFSIQVKMNVCLFVYDCVVVSLKVIGVCHRPNTMCGIIDLKCF